MMAKLIKIHDENAGIDRHTIWLNPEHIVSIQPTYDNPDVYFILTLSSCTPQLSKANTLALIKEINDAD